MSSMFLSLGPSMASRFGPSGDADRDLGGSALFPSANCFSIACLNSSS